LGWSTVVLLNVDGRYALFDTGGWGDRPTLLTRLKALGVDPHQVDLVVLSHLHFDHVGNVECFPQAEVILHAAELAYYREHAHRDLALPVFQIEGMLARANITVVEGEPEVMPGVRLIQTPGHTGGHCSLVLTVDGKRVVLAQDAIKHRGELESCGVTAGFAPGIAAASIARIRAMADLVIPGHDGPLALSNGQVTVLERPKETFTLTLDNRSLTLEA
jgi:N-acyl homoserine lactone hydrolase